MRRTEILQEVRKMRFEEAYGGWTEGQLSQEEAARILGVCSRTFRRYTYCYEENGLEGLLDKRLTQASFRRAPVDEVMGVSERYRTKHICWNVKQANRYLATIYMPAFNAEFMQPAAEEGTAFTKWTIHLLQNRTILFVDNIFKFKLC